MRTFLSAISAAAFMVFAPASADPAALEAVFASGDYRSAAVQAEAQADADGLAFAARSLLAEAMSAPDYIPPQDVVEKAEAVARRAIQLDAGHVEGRLQLAIALSLRAHPLTTRQAMRAGYGDEAKALAVEVLKDDPRNPYANGFMAVWHIEVVRRGGSVGSAIMGASVNRGRKLYAIASEEHPDDAALHWSYARALAALNAKKYRSEIDTAIARALNATPQTELERIMQARAKILKTALETQKRKQVENLAEQML